MQVRYKISELEILDKIFVVAAISLVISLFFYFFSVPGNAIFFTISIYVVVLSKGGKYYSLMKRQENSIQKKRYQDQFTYFSLASIFILSYGYIPDQIVILSYGTWILGSLFFWQFINVRRNNKKCRGPNVSSANLARAQTILTLAISSGDLSRYFESFSLFETAYRKAIKEPSVSNERIAEIQRTYANVLFKFRRLTGDRGNIQLALKKYNEAIRAYPSNIDLTVSLTKYILYHGEVNDEINAIIDIIPILKEQRSLRSSRIARIKDRISKIDPILISAIYPTHINFLVGRITGDDNHIKKSFEIFENHLKHYPTNIDILVDWVDFLVEYATMKEGVIRAQLLREARVKALISEEVEEGSATESLARIYALEHDADNSLIWIMKFLSREKICYHKLNWLKNKAFDGIRNDPRFREIMFYYHPNVTIKDGIEGLMKRMPAIDTEKAINLSSNAPNNWPDVQMNPFSSGIDPLLLKITVIATLGRAFYNTVDMKFSLFRKYISTMGILEVPLVVTIDKDEYPIFIFHEPGKEERDYFKFVSEFFTNRGMRAIYYSTSAFEFSTFENYPDLDVKYAYIPSYRKEDQRTEDPMKVTYKIGRDIEFGAHENAVTDMIEATKPQMVEISLNDIQQETDADEEDLEKNFRWMFNGFTGTVFQKNDDFELDQTFAIWWSTKEEPLFRDSPSRQYLQRAYQAMDGIEGYVYASILNDTGYSCMSYEILRRTLPIETDHHPLIGPEDVQIIMSVSREKGIRFAFPISSTSIEYRYAFHKNFTRYCEFRKKWIEKINIENPPDDGEAPVERPLNWWNMVEASTIKTQESEESTEMNIGAIMAMNMN